MFNKIKENKKGGFTLVELIIVLVILAVLAAFLVPTLTGYVDKADEKSLISETRLVVMAAQSISDEVYAEGKTPELGNDKTVTNAAIQKLAEVSGTTTTITYDAPAEGAPDYTPGKIVTLVYEEKAETGVAQKKCTYTYNKETGAGTYTVEKIGS